MSANYTESTVLTTLVGSGDVVHGRGYVQDNGLVSQSRPTPSADKLYAYETESMVLSSNARIPSERGVVVKIDDELIFADRTAGNELRRLTRGYDGTVAADHQKGATVTLMRPISQPG